MFQYIVKRFFLIIPTWLVISVVIFSLSRCATGDVVGEKLGSHAESNSTNGVSDALYAEKAHELGLDKPTFYAALLPAAFPDTLYKILRRDERDALESLIWQYGNWPAIADFRHQATLFLSKSAQNTPDESGQVEGGIFQNKIKSLLLQDNDAAILFQLEELKRASDTTVFKNDVAKIAESYAYLKQNLTRQQLYIPKIYWFGDDNQYHHWLTQFLKGNFGFSTDDRAVLEMLKAPLSITVILSLCTLILAYIIGVFLGVFVATNRHKRCGQWTLRGLFAVYSLPTFWLATLAAMFLTTGHYGVKLFPMVGFANDIPTGATIWQTLVWNADRLILPILCMAIHPSVIIARQMQGAIVDILKKEYIQTARAKGLSQRRIIWGHAFRNALTPLITLLGQMIPATVTGAFAIELIFNLPGMGRTTIDAIFLKDWPVVFAVLMLVSFVILLSNLLVDVLYRWFNPRVRFS